MPVAAMSMRRCGASWAASTREAGAGGVGDGGDLGQGSDLTGDVAGPGHGDERERGGGEGGGEGGAQVVEGLRDRRRGRQDVVRAARPGEQVRVVFGVEAEHRAGDGTGEEGERVGGVAGEDDDVVGAGAQEPADGLAARSSTAVLHVRGVAGAAVHARVVGQHLGDVVGDVLQGPGAGGGDRGRRSAPAPR